MREKPEPHYAMNKAGCLLCLPTARRPGRVTVQKEVKESLNLQVDTLLTQSVRWVIKIVSQFSFLKQASEVIMLCMCLNACVFFCPFKLLNKSTDFREIPYKIPPRVPKTCTS
jgi:hypothetical protein